MNGSLKKNWDFTSGNEPDRIENATHNTLVNVLWVAFSILSGSLFLLKSTVRFEKCTRTTALIYSHLKMTLFVKFFYQFCGTYYSL
jgi:hypothetical protein